ncbi:MAG TPA: hypothetical protein PK573_12760 [Spirochaetota bacterium]|nr:hypothetical protein [Spirochaetota bacterium]HRZ27711.1 hypothetical protein [Spirochaetota bacterium]
MTQASDFTLYSGGLRGAEAEFGTQAEKYGVAEVTFSYDGHKPDREKNVIVLSGADLDSGDVSMEIVSRRMGRNFPEAEKIRKVIQSIYHMVNRGFQVFSVGWIQADNTVKGGTGWGVELAKLFNRPVSVYDQDRNVWVTWTDNTWKADSPVIEHKTFCASGTRYLSREAALAIQDLFARSFEK